MRPIARRSLAHVALLGCIVTLPACGDGPLQPGGGSSLRMSIDGQQWTAVSVTANNINGIVGTGAADLAGVGFGFAFQGSTTGTYMIAANSPTNATYSEGGNGWAATSAGGSGTITVTTLNAERVAGTFTFQVNAVGQHMPATRSITNGVFDIEF
ncbi:MAG: DUF6252 family protein [Gemmatimonadota bacterium]|nr:DUF6252 family protein [Gemmatimonadota bacterium]